MHFREPLYSVADLLASADQQAIFFGFPDVLYCEVANSYF
jgi:hypothetical protein